MSLVLTAPCRWASENLSCEAALGRLFSYVNLNYFEDPSHLANETSPWDLASRLLSTITFSKSGFDMDKLSELQRDATITGKDKVYIYCAPCICQIWTAFRICSGAGGPAKALFQYCVRIDGRLTASFCQVPSGTAGIAAIVEQIRSIEMDETRSYDSLSRTKVGYIDRDWIDKRLYDQEDEIFQISAVGEARSFSFIFDQFKVMEDLAAVIILGERDHLVPMLQSSPFQKSERILRENQFFQVMRKEIDREWRWSLKYLGSFTAKRSLSAQATNSSSSHPQGQHYLHETSMTAAASNSRSREASPSTNASVKRRRTETTSDD